MSRYFSLQIKRIWRYLPGAFCVVVLLLSCLFTAFSLMVNQNTGQEANKKARVAISGFTEDPFLQMGLTAMQAFDSTQYTLEIVQMDEAEARQALEWGKIAAYVVVPEGFMDAAFRGEILPLKFVSTAGSASLVSIVRYEITETISTILVSSQKGIFGMANAMRDNGLGKKLGTKMDELSFVYLDYVFVRDNIYTLEELGIGDNLDFSGYLLCGLCVMLTMLMSLPFAPLMIRRDHSLARMLAARGCSVPVQSLCEFAAYFLALFVVMLPVPLLLAKWPDVVLSSGELILQTVPVVMMAASFSYFLYVLSSDLISGVLLQFFTTVAVCFVSGCVYPVHFFPVELQKAAAWLPTAFARSQLAGSFTGKTDTFALLMLLCCSLVFLTAGIIIRLRQVKGVHQ